MKSEPDIIEFAQVMADLQQTREQLTRVQNECTKLLLEKRELPQFDANGPLLEQGKVLCPPGMPCPGYEWPRIGIIHPHFFLNQKCYRYTTEPDASKHLRTKLGETWNWLLGCGERGKKPHGFALYRRVKPAPDNEDFIDEADTEELAVALCALKSVGIEVGRVE